MTSLEDLGWSPELQSAFDSLSINGSAPARVTEQRRNWLRVATPTAELSARTSGGLRHRATSQADLPAVGDWVAIVARDDGSTTIRALLPRRTALMRKSVSETTPQVIAANVDSVFVVGSCNRDFNPRRLERTVALAWESGAQPVILLSKTDLSDAVEEILATAEQVSPGVPVHPLSAHTGEGLEQLDPYLARGRTVVVVGSSGVGKSTLINRLMGEEVLAVAEIRESDARGRHTTSHRQLFRLRSGALIIDTPGVREVGLWDASEGLGETFSDIEQWAGSCRFGDCRHQSEPGCAVRQAVEDGHLPAERLANFESLQREMAYLERRKDEHAAREASRKFTRMVHTYTKEQRRRRKR